MLDTIVIIIDSRYLKYKIQMKLTLNNSLFES